MDFRRKLQSLENIISMGEKLLTTFDVTELLDALVDSASSLLESEGATLYLVDPFEKCLTSQSIHADGIKEVTVAIDNRSIAGYTAANRMSINITDAYGDLSHIPPELKFNCHYDEVSGRKTRNLITHPLLINDELIGVFQVINKKNGDFDESDQTILKNFSLVAAIAIMNARLMERVMEAQAGAYNVMESASDMVIVQNGSGCLLHLNRSAVDYLRGKGRNAEVVGRSFVDVFPELSNLTAEIQKVVDGQLDRSVSTGKPAFVIFTEKNICHQIEKVILMIRRPCCSTREEAPEPSA
ncbi:MAG TPA: GAF domain-containing protein [Candidatus Rifleibacterium sp.]|nr:GAF domain-containing protein [Candidatus Rifleibacterium sp.]